MKISLDEVRDIAESVRRLSREQLDEAGGKYPPSLYYAFFRALARIAKPKFSVVLGVCGGGDCYHLATGYPKGKVLGIDIAYDHPESVGYLESMCKNFEFWLGNSLEEARSAFDKYGPVDLLFVDTTHDYDQTTQEWNTWKPYLAPGAVVCFDDLFRPGVGEAWEKFPEPKERLDWLHPGQYPEGGGFGALIMPQPTPKLIIPPQDYELGN